MCGINGIFAYHYAANPIDREELLRTRDHMAARGPDGMGAWFAEDSRVGLGHRRLSIIDLSDAGAQPMLSADGRFAVSFNGEIYNYRELRRGLEERGCLFHSQCDTEVLLHLYAEKGAAMVHDLRGMFAFAIWDGDCRRLFLARDPYGIKPLYYADNGWTFRFASQVKALLAGGAVSRDLEPAGLAGFYIFGSVPEPFTLFGDIRALPAGSTLYVEHTGSSSPASYYSIAGVYCDAEAMARSKKIAKDEARTRIKEALLDSVRHHLAADVPVGAFLSGGIDSSVLVSLMRQAGQRDIQTVTLAFEEFRGLSEDESVLAAEVARLYGTQHTTRLVTKSEFATDLPVILEAMDQPSIDGINTWFVSKAARELGLKVAVSGLGGDEVFGGYPSFRDVPRWVSLMRIPGQVPFLGRLLRLVLQRATGFLGNNPKIAGMAEIGGTYAGAYILRRGLFMPWELDDLFDPEMITIGIRRLGLWRMMNAALTPRPKSAFARVSVLELSLYMRNQLLRDTDWSSMAHGLEVRVPLVDSVLLSRLAYLTCADDALIGKAPLAAAAAPPLPDAVRVRSKSGFMTPIADWQREIFPSGGARVAGSPWARNWANSVIGDKNRIPRRLACAS